MKNKILLLLLFQAAAFNSQAQITGSDTVCAGFLYTFNASIAGADSFAWSMPGGWAVINGPGTSQIQVLCTQNVGQVCVDGYDVNGNFLAQYCHAVYWGDGGLGWNLSIMPAHMCQCPPFIASAIPNGTGGGCAGCGNGTISPNLSYLIYDNPLPGGNYYGIADGFTPNSLPFVTTTFYVYLVDVTFGINNAIVIEGGLCPATLNNSFTLGPCTYVNLPIIANPDPACVGDTVEFHYDGSFGSFNSYSWSVWQGNATIVPPYGYDTAWCVMNAVGSVTINLTCFDFNGCPYAGQFSLNVNNCSAQVTGDSIVCSGNSYNYSSTIPGAVTYTWSLPSGWYGLTGQGTSNITATCNVSTGNICVEGFDQNGNSVGIECITTQWGNGGGQGWDVQPSSVSRCLGDSSDLNLTLQPNGTGGGACPPGCGNGILHPNLVYGLYDNSSPFKLFMGAINGSPISIPSGAATYFVYFVDTTLGADFPDAIMITGGCGVATNNNVVTVSAITPPPPILVQSPDPACVGDTVLISEVQNNVTNSYWQAFNGITMLNNPTPEEALVVITNSFATIGYFGYDQMNGCFTGMSYNVNIVGCLAPVAAFSATTNPICPGTCTAFANLSTNATSYQWFFPGGNPQSDTVAFPTNICYNTPGNYDVTLVAINASGSDTLTLPNYITVNPYPPAQSIVQNGDTLISNQGFITYQWYYNSNLIAGATEYFYVAIQNGDYNLICSDSNGCEVEAAIFNVLTGMNHYLIEQNLFTVFPNPANQFLMIDMEIKSNDVISIYNVVGEKIKIYKNISMKINVSDLKSGIYFLEISSGEKIRRARFIKD